MRLSVAAWWLDDPVLDFASADARVEAPGREVLLEHVEVDTVVRETPLRLEGGRLEQQAADAAALQAGQDVQVVDERTQAASARP